MRTKRIDLSRFSVSLSATDEMVVRIRRRGWEQITVDKINVGKLRTLTVGSRVFYPSHGVASVTGREDRQFGGEKQAFYVLKLDRGATVLVPANKVDESGIRRLISPKMATELLKKIKADPDDSIKIGRASRRAVQLLHTEALRSGSADRYTAVLQEILFRSRSSKLSFSERQSLDVALAYFVGEISAVLNVPPEQVEEEVRPVANSGSSD